MKQDTYQVVSLSDDHTICKEEDLLYYDTKYCTYRNGETLGKPYKDFLVRLLQHVTWGNIYT